MKKKILYIFIILFIGLFSSSSVNATQVDPCEQGYFYCPDGQGYMVIWCDYEDLVAYAKLLCGVTAY